MILITRTHNINVGFQTVTISTPVVFPNRLIPMFERVLIVVTKSNILKVNLHQLHPKTCDVKRAMRTDKNDVLAFPSLRCGRKQMGGMGKSVCQGGWVGWEGKITRMLRGQSTLVLSVTFWGIFRCFPAFLLSLRLFA